MSRVLVVAKAPVAGRVKTRLGADVGMTTAADLAAAALLDTLDAAAALPVRTRHLALDGVLAGARGEDDLRRAAAGWTITPQSGGDFGRRLAQAHRELPGPVVQIGMDTPQVTAPLLSEVLAGLDEHDAVLGPAADGGWWVLALRDPSYAAVLAGVTMSASTTGAESRAALTAAGLHVGTAPELRDVDTVADAEAVVASAPQTRFARAWRARTAVAR